MSIEPATKADQEKMSIGLQRLSEEDPTFGLSSNEETGQTIIAGMGELHLDIIAIVCSVSSRLKLLPANLK